MREPLAPSALRLRQIRWLVGLFIAGLVLSGITAFPLVHELGLLARFFGVERLSYPPPGDGLAWWIWRVHEGLMRTSEAYPFLAYGTDWLAFSHLVISVFFIGAWVDPARNVWVIWAGVIACTSVIPLALICGPLRGIPFYWRLIDCSFGAVGVIPLLAVLRLLRPPAGSP